MKFKLTILVVAMGAVSLSCSESKEGGSGVAEGIPTYVNFEITLPGTMVGRAAPDLPEDYNPDGTYEGNDGIETLDIYMRSSDGTIEAKRFLDDDIASDGTVIYPSEPFRTTSGVKTVYVVINDPNPLETTITSENTLVDTDGLARYVTRDGITYDVITMTGKAENVTIEPDIPVTGVTAGENRVAVTVNRVASRVIVTISRNASETLEDEDGNIIGTVSNVTWTVAQGTNKIYWIEQPNFITYGYDYVPVLGDYYGGDAVTYYDFSSSTTMSPFRTFPRPGTGINPCPVNSSSRTPTSTEPRRQLHTTAKEIPLTCW